MECGIVKPSTQEFGKYSEELWIVSTFKGNTFFLLLLLVIIAKMLDYLIKSD